MRRAPVLTFCCNCRAKSMEDQQQHDALKWPEFDEHLEHPRHGAQVHLVSQGCTCQTHQLLQNAGILGLDVVIISAFVTIILFAVVVIVSPGVVICEKQHYSKCFQQHNTHVPQSEHPPHNLVHVHFFDHDCWLVLHQPSHPASTTITGVNSTASVIETHISVTRTGCRSRHSSRSEW